MLRANTRRRAIWTAKNNRAAHLSTRHIISFRSRIDDVVNCLHGEIEGHEFDDWSQAAHRSTSAYACKTIFGNGRINDAACAEFVKQPLRDFIRALILGDFLTHDKYAVIAAHFLCHGVAQCFTQSYRLHIAVRNDWVGIGRYRSRCLVRLCCRRRVGLGVDFWCSRRRLLFIFA